MSALGSPALRLLARRKFAGFWRRQLRRMRTLKGAVLALLGLTMILFWIGSMFVTGWRRDTGSDAQTLEAMVTAALLALSVLSITNALTFRGLYLHPSEIETLFSAPVSRSDLIRFRLFSNILRTLFGALFFGLLMARSAPEPLYGALGAATAMLTLPIFSQGMSILAGDAENRFAARLAKLPLRRLTLLLFLATLYALYQFGSHDAGRFASHRDLIGSILRHPLARALALPFQPWVHAITAHSVREFLPWFAVCLAIPLVLFELVARIPVDFRELSLETSADVAKRLARARRGITSSGPAGRSTRSWTIPWILGRGPLGAVVWRKFAGVVRKAGTSFLVGAAITAAVAVLALNVPGSQAWVPPLMVAMFGTFYLSVGLRSDFREDLDMMPAIKAWPIEGWKLFLATLLPETLLVSLMIEAGIAGVSFYSGAFDPLLAVLCLAVPLVVLTWIAIDNVVFLFAPVRHVPGQDSALQNAGRAILLLAARGGVLAVVALGASLPALACAFLLRTSARTTIAVGGLCGLAVLAVELCAVVWLGGWSVKRFDVASDRG